MGTKVLLGIVGALGLIAIVLGLSVVSPYNTLVRLDQAAQAQWGQVENVYQRRADLVPSLVETVKGAANFEKDTLTAVTEARAKVGQVTPGAMQNKPKLEPGSRHHWPLTGAKAPGRASRNKSQRRCCRRESGRLETALRRNLRGHVDWYGLPKESKD